MGSVAVPQISIPRNSRFGVLDRVQVRNREECVVPVIIERFKERRTPALQGTAGSEPEFDLVKLVEFIYATMGR